MASIDLTTLPKEALIDMVETYAKHLRYQSEAITNLQTKLDRAEDALKLANDSIDELNSRLSDTPNRVPPFRG